MNVCGFAAFGRGKITAIWHLNKLNSIKAFWFRISKEASGEHNILLYRNATGHFLYLCRQNMSYKYTVYCTQEDKGRQYAHTQDVACFPGANISSLKIMKLFYLLCCLICITVTARVSWSANSVSSFNWKRCPWFKLSEILLCTVKWSNGLKLSDSPPYSQL